MEQMNIKHIMSYMDLKESIDLICFHSKIPVAIMHVDNSRFRMIHSSEKTFHRRNSCTLFMDIGGKGENKLLCRLCDEACARIFYGDPKQREKRAKEFEADFGTEAKIKNHKKGINERSYLLFICPYLGYSRFAIPVEYNKQTICVIFAGQFISKDGISKHKRIISRLYDRLYETFGDYSAFIELSGIQKGIGQVQLKMDSELSIDEMKQQGIVRKDKQDVQETQDKQKKRLIGKYLQHLSKIDVDGVGERGKKSVSNEELEAYLDSVMKETGFFELQLKSKIIEREFFDNVGEYEKGNYRQADKLTAAFEKSLKQLVEELGFISITAYYRNIMPPIKDDNVGYFFAGSSDGSLKKALERVEYRFGQDIDKPTNPQISLWNNKTRDKLFDSFFYAESYEYDKLSVVFENGKLRQSNHIVLRYQHWVLLFCINDHLPVDYSNLNEAEVATKERYDKIIMKILPFINNLVLRTRGAHSRILKDQYELILKVNQHETSHISIVTDEKADNVEDFWGDISPLLKTRTERGDFLYLKNKYDNLVKDIRSTSGLIKHMSILLGIIVGKITKEDILADKGFERMSNQIDAFRDLFFKWRSAYRINLIDKGIDLTITDENTELRRGKFDAVNRYLVEVAVYNLIENAVKYCFYNTRIYMDSALYFDSSSTLVLTIEDFGIGLPKDKDGKLDRERLFEPFYRSPTAMTLEPSGDGLGLYVSRMVCEALSLYLDCSQEFVSSFNIPMVLTLLDRLNSWSQANQDELVDLKNKINSCDVEGKDEFIKLKEIDVDAWKSYELDRLTSIKNATKKHYLSRMINDNPDMRLREMTMSEILRDINNPTYKVMFSIDHPAKST